MVTSFAPEDLPMLDRISPGQGVQSLGIYGDASHSGRYRAAVESVLVFRVMTQLNGLLEKDGFLGKTHHRSLMNLPVLYIHLHKCT